MGFFKSLIRCKSSKGIDNESSEQSFKVRRPGSTTPPPSYKSLRSGFAGYSPTTESIKGDSYSTKRLKKFGLTNQVTNIGGRVDLIMGKEVGLVPRPGTASTPGNEKGDLSDEDEGSADSTSSGARDYKEPLDFYTACLPGDVSSPPEIIEANGPTLITCQSAFYLTVRNSQGAIIRVYVS